MTNKEYFMYRWNYELPITENALRLVPESGWEYKPHPKTGAQEKLLNIL